MLFRLPVLMISLPLLLGSVQGAFACACCTDPGYRHVASEVMDAYRSGELKRIRFAKDAQLFENAGGLEDVHGITDPSESYTLVVSQDGPAINFTFKDERGKGGTLVLPIPKTVSVFEVDPRLSDEIGGNGPSLFKEWRFTGPASGTGAFAKGTGAGRKITLILQGHGGACTGAEDFVAWTLVVFDEKTEFSLFGRLEAPK
jgi:hypothetical protein